MKRRIFRFRCAKPGDIGGPALPCIQVSDEDDPASETASSIFYYTKAGKAAAERVAKDLACMGFAVVYRRVKPRRRRRLARRVMRSWMETETRHGF